MARARGLPAPLLGLALALSLPAPGAAACGSLGPPERLAFAPAARARWLAPRVRPPGPLDPLYGAARGFLAAVQRNPFPAELVKALLNEPASLRLEEVVRYEAGYVACAAVAALYLLGMPAAGLCLCCCRGRRRCGGRVKTEHKALACQRGALVAFLLGTTVVLLVGVACAFATSQRVHAEMGPSVEAVPETLLSLGGLVADVPQELQALARQFSLPQQRVLEELDGVGVSLGSTLHSQLRSTVHPALASVLSLGHALQVSVDHLQALNATSVGLQERQDDLRPAVGAHRDHLLALLQEPGCRGCADALGMAGALELGADFSQLPPVADVLLRLKGAPEANFSRMVREENSTFNNLPLLAALQTADVVRELQKAVARQPEELRTLARAFPGSEAASRWSQALGEAARGSRPYLREAQRYERYRWIAGCVLCSALLLVVACNLLGLGLGTWGLATREDPSHAEPRAEAGARLLMAGAGLGFLLAAPLVLLVLAAFLLGGNVQTLVCRGWARGELYEFADTPGNLPASLNLSHLLGLRKNVSVRLAYQQCREGAALWRVLQLNDSYDLERHLDISQYTAKLRQELRRLQVDVRDLDLLSPAARRDLEALRRSGLEQVPYADFLAQIRKPVVTVDVETLAQELEGLARAQGNVALGLQLQEAARALRSLYRERVLPQQGLVPALLPTGEAQPQRPGPGIHRARSPGGNLGGPGQGHVPERGPACPGRQHPEERKRVPPGPGDGLLLPVRGLGAGGGDTAHRHLPAPLWSPGQRPRAPVRHAGRPLERHLALPGLVRPPARAQRRLRREGRQVLPPRPEAPQLHQLRGDSALHHPPCHRPDAVAGLSEEGLPPDGLPSPVLGAVVIPAARVLRVSGTPGTGKKEAGEEMGGTPVH
nr:prominin-2 isoform X2 [Dasypus novemcinctus]